MNFGHVCDPEISYKSVIYLIAKKTLLPARMNHNLLLNTF
jgi:hypothetical protein